MAGTIIPTPSSEYNLAAMVLLPHTLVSATPLAFELAYLIMETIAILILLVRNMLQLIMLNIMIHNTILATKINHNSANIIDHATTKAIEHATYS